MNRTAVSPALVALTVIVVAGAGATAYYLGVMLPSEHPSTTALRTSSMPSSSSSIMSTVSSPSSMSSSSTQSSSSTSSAHANLQIVTSHISHKLGGNSLGATCGSAMPAPGASFLQVTNNGTAAAEITGISISYVEMMTSSGAPSNSCLVGVGATEYITLTGVGADPTDAGIPYTLTLIATNGAYANANGTFG